MQVLTSKEYLKTETGIRAEAELKRMAQSLAFETTELFNSRVDSDLSFIDRHIKYLVNHPNVKATNYLMNLKVMTKVKR